MNKISLFLLLGPFLIQLQSCQGVIEPTNNTKSWQIISTSISEDLLDIYFVDSNHGWMIGKNIILKTENGGREWRIQKQVNETLSSIQFINLQTGYLGTIGNNYLLKTENDGDDWIPKQLPEIGNKFYFLNSGIGWFGIGGAQSAGWSIYRTNDEANSWIRKYGEHPPNNGFNLKDIYFKDENTGWIGFSVWYHDYLISAQVAIIYHTTDGISWKPLGPSHNDYLTSLQFIDNKTGYFAGRFLMKTTDWGSSWQKTTLESPTDFMFVDTRLGWAIKGGNIYYTKNGGNDWKKEELDYHLNALFFLNADNGWAVGNGGTVLRYGY